MAIKIQKKILFYVSFNLKLFFFTQFYNKNNSKFQKNFLIIYIQIKK